MVYRVLHSVVKYLLLLMKTELALLLAFFFIGIITAGVLYIFRKSVTAENCKPDPNVSEWSTDCTPIKCVDDDALPEDKCVRYHRCDPQYGPDYSTRDDEERNEIIKTYTSQSCYDSKLCWDDDLQKCFNVKN